MAQHSNPSAMQEISLDDVSGIEIRAARLGLVVEADSELTGVARLLVEPGNGAPELTKEGSRLIVSQDGRYHGTSSPVLKLPTSDLPPLAANISRGDLRLENLQTAIAINIDSGNLHISGGEGDTAANLSSGNATIRQREGDVACRIDSGQFGLVHCHGDIAVNVSKGAVDLLDSSGTFKLQMDSGDVSVTRPVEQDLRISLTKGDVRINGGSLTGADIDVTRGEINSTARLLFTEPADEPDELDEIEGVIDAAIDEAVGALDEEVRFNLGSVEFIAGEAGVRISAGGTERFVAGPEGLLLRRADGTPFFSASESGVRLSPTIGRGGREHFRFRTNRGSISIDVADDQSTRVELIVNRGSVQSDIPLVEVGRPGPRSSTRRYVGVSDSSETDRILVRALTNRGDIRVRTARAARGPSPATRISNRERQRRQILEALAQGKITADEADVLLAAMERESG